MPTNRGFFPIYVEDTGGVFSLDITEIHDCYLVSVASGDTGTLSGNVTITGSSSGVINDTYVLVFANAFVKGAFTFTVFGQSLTATQLLSKPIVIAKDNGGGGYNVYLQSNSTGVTVETANIADEAITLAKMQDLPEGAILVGDATNRPSQADFSASGRIPIGNGTTVASTSVGGDATLASDGTLTIANDAVNNNKLANIPRGSIKVGGAADAPTDLDCSGIGRFPLGDGTDVNATTMSGDATIDGTGAVTISNSAVTVAKATTALKTEVLTIPVSFETGEQCDNKVKMPYDGVVNEIYGVVTKALAGTDAGTIQAKDDSGTDMTSGLLTFPLSSALETAVTATPTANNTFSAGDVLSFTSAKTTAGGKVLISVKITKT